MSVSISSEPASTNGKTPPKQAAAGADVDTMNHDFPDAQKSVAWVTGGLAALATILSTFGTSIGGTVVERVVRNEPIWFLIGIGFLLIAVTMPVLVLVGKFASARPLVLVLSAATLMLGVLILAVPFALVQAEHAVPTISATISTDENGPKLDGVVKSSGIPTDKVIRTYVDGLDMNGAIVTGQTHLFRQIAGPDLAGAIESPLHLNVLPGTFDAFVVYADIVAADTAGTDAASTPVAVETLAGEVRDPCASHEACQFVSEPVQPLQPVLSTTWESVGTTEQALAVNVVSDALRRDQVVSLWVVAIPPGNLQSRGNTTFDTLYLGRLYRGVNGNLNISVRVPVSKPYTNVCVGTAAHMNKFDVMDVAPPTCPTDPHAPIAQPVRGAPSWARFQVPQGE